METLADSHTKIRQERVLLTEDLVHDILEYLAIDPRSDWNSFSEYHGEVVASRKQLHSAALISRCFVHPALNLLWRTIDSVKPLLDLLPESLLSLDDGEYTVLHRSPKAQLEAADLQRFNYYAQMVKAFCLKQPDPALKLPVYHALAHHGVPMPFFPRLQSLHIEDLSASAEDPLLFHILAPSLRRVMISTYADPKVVRTILASLLSQAPDLCYFRSHVPLPKDAMEWVLDFDQLRRLRLDFPLCAIFQPESKLNRLTHLTHMSLDFGAISSADIVDNATIPCEALTRLSITCKPSVIFSLVEALELPNIREAILTLCSFDTLPKNRFIFASIRRWAPTLEALTVNGGRAMPLNAIYYHTQKAKLSRFKRLRYFKVYGLRTNIFAPPKCEELDFSLSTLASILPNVEYLSLPTWQQTISYHTLCMVLVRCRQLRFLQVGINPQTFPPKKLGRNAFPCGVLEMLAVGDGKDFDPFLIAHHLLRLFPHLKTVLSSSERWNAVNELVDFTRSLMMDKLNYPEVTPGFLEDFSARWSFRPDVEGDVGE
ncbi:hypothetical protein BDN72DRAFT_441672 [Pluteus cervinus]|uniref:Uncharacterized protein n=1 Tax=Pluteus cervinus TaxID=181527 RepID=A0ACD3BCS3_9AGAR|nr:hypothetical protein BDN72DRAFT_441672 [Pluteus cervinus]